VTVRRFEVRLPVSGSVERLPLETFDGVDLVEFERCLVAGCETRVRSGDADVALRDDRAEGWECWTVRVRFEPATGADIRLGCRLELRVGVSILDPDREVALDRTFRAVSPPRSVGVAATVGRDALDLRAVPLLDEGARYAGRSEDRATGLRVRLFVEFEDPWSGSTVLPTTRSLVLGASARSTVAAAFRSTSRAWPSGRTMRTCRPSMVAFRSAILASGTDLPVRRSTSVRDGASRDAITEARGTLRVATSWLTAWCATLSEPTRDQGTQVA
jgi:hypothetical protein